MRCLPVRQIEQDFIDITPAPTLRRIIALNDRMPGSVEMPGRVSVGGIVAAADVAAAAADPQMQPLTAALQAFLATERARRDAADAGDVAAAVCHDRSHLAGIEQKHIGAPGGKGLHVPRPGLTLAPP